LEKKKYMIVGAGGLFGRHMAAHLKARGEEAVVLSRKQLDASNPEAVKLVVGQVKPHVLINAVALTDVDGCERDPEQAHLLNSVVPTVLASAARDHDALLVHVSTDYVFSGAVGAYTESDLPDPINIYGATKLEGEHAVVEAGGEWLIVRTSGLYGPGGKNFISKLPDLLRSTNEVHAIDDLILSPTYVEHLCWVVEEMVVCKSRGLYHMVNQDAVSWYEAALMLAKHLGIANRVNRVSRSDIRFTAQRPLNSSLRVDRLVDELFCVPYVDEALYAFARTCS